MQAGTMVSCKGGWRKEAWDHRRARGGGLSEKMGGHELVSIKTMVSQFRSKAYQCCASEVLDPSALS